jgi:hypothetical protein
MTGKLGPPPVIAPSNRKALPKIKIPYTVKTYRPTDLTINKLVMKFIFAYDEHALFLLEFLSK